jgi:hypothetical protein
MMRRLAFCVFCLLLTAGQLGWGATGTRISNRGARTWFWFWDADSACYLDSSDIRSFYAYPSYLAGGDTAAAGTALGYLHSTTAASWYMDVDKDEIWRVWRYDTLITTQLMIDSLYLPGGQLGDSAITSRLAFMPQVLPPSAFITDSIYTVDHIKADTFGVHGDNNVYRGATWALPTASCVLDTFVNFPEGGANLVSHKVYMSGADVGDLFQWLWYPGVKPGRPSNTVSTIAFALQCTVTDSVTVTPQYAGTLDYYDGDSVIAIVELGNFLGD